MAPGVVVELVAVGEDPLDEGGCSVSQRPTANRLIGTPASAAVSRSRLTRAGSPGQVEGESDLVPGA
jgi:hypothetical protein